MSLGSDGEPVGTAVDGEPVALAREDLGRANGVVARAFATDLVYCFALPASKGFTDEDRLAAAHWAMGLSLKYGHHFGQVFVAQDANADPKAVAVWLSPDSFPISVIKGVKAGLLGGLWRQRPGVLFRLLRCLATSERLRRRHCSGPMWHLLTLAVDPDRQGRGLGSRLLDHGLVRVDAARLPCVLDTENPAAARLYESRGFRVVETARVGKDGPVVRLMIRPARC